MSVVVFGSINMDLVARVPRLPAAGETLTGRDFFAAPGGKGANQAVACARLGAPTLMVGRVGTDSVGAQLRSGLEAAGIDTAGVLTTPGPSGVAQIAVDDRGQNTIIVVPGANGAVGLDDIGRLEHYLEGARALLLQLEVPPYTVVAAAAAARRRGVTVILDPAPAGGLPDALYSLADILTPNESEAAALVGFALDDDEAAGRAATILRRRTGGVAIVKRGAQGATLCGPEGVRHLAPFAVAAIDSVAAGDAFNGALAAALSEGLSLDGAARWAMATGALAVTRRGAQEAMPSRDEVLALLEGR
jgi:ribokinase